MARLADLIPGFAQVLQIPVGTVRNVASVLRASKLLTTGPRGPGAPNMTPTDATNLLLGLMYDDTHDAVATNVPRLRESPMTSYRGKLGYDYGGTRVEHIPPHDFIGKGGQAYSLGDVLDAMFDRIVRYGALDDAPSDKTALSEWPYVKNISVSISRPGYAGRVWIDTISVHWTLAYTWQDPAELARRAEAIEQGVDPRMIPLGLGTFMHRTRSVQDEELAALATVLRGYEVDDADPDLDITPPYETLETSE